MKNVTFFSLFVFFFAFTNAQEDRYTQAMSANQEKGKAAQTTSDFLELANSYERIAVCEKNQWIAWYYAALYNLFANFNESNIAQRQRYIDQALKLTAEGIKVKSDESEFLVLKVLAYYSEMSIDQSKGMDLYPKTIELLDQAKSLNPDNPRIYLTQAEAVFGMPTAFGGGKDKAKPILMSAKERFDKYVPANQFSPNWGKERCEQLLGQCQGSK
jgi:tetratricopeptide (TPR) repeat protein